MKNVDIVFVFVDVKAKCCFVAERNNFVEQQLRQNNQYASFRGWH